MGTTAGTGGTRAVAAAAADGSGAGRGGRGGRGRGSGGGRSWAAPGLLLLRCRRRRWSRQWGPPPSRPAAAWRGRRRGSRARGRLEPGRRRAECERGGRDSAGREGSWRVLPARGGDGAEEGGGEEDGDAVATWDGKDGEEE